jgi:FtsZ-binding cell division protein ZapB
MTDEQIIKALECCVIGYECPKDCPYMGKGLCVDKIRKDALDLINRQKAEIERLEETKNRLSYNLQAVLDERADHSEAVKEFAERLKEKERPAFPLAMVIDVYEIDNLVKEMVGEG